jgi:hypothetical protein
LHLAVLKQDRLDTGGVDAYVCTGGASLVALVLNANDKSTVTGIEMKLRNTAATPGQVLTSLNMLSVCLSVCCVCYRQQLMPANGRTAILYPKLRLEVTGKCRVNVTPHPTSTSECH